MRAPPGEKHYRILKTATCRDWEYDTNRLYCWVGKRIYLECEISISGIPKAFHAWQEDVQLDIWFQFDGGSEDSVREAWRKLCKKLIIYYSEIHSSCVKDLVLWPLDGSIVKWDEPE